MDKVRRMDRADTKDRAGRASITDIADTTDTTDFADISDTADITDIPNTIDTMDAVDVHPPSHPSSDSIPRASDSAEPPLPPRNLKALRARFHGMRAGPRSEHLQAIGLGLVFLLAGVWAFGKESSDVDSSLVPERPRPEPSFPRPERIGHRSDRIRPSDITAYFARRSALAEARAVDDDATPGPHRRTRFSPVLVGGNAHDDASSTRDVAKDEDRVPGQDLDEGNLGLDEGLGLDEEGDPGSKADRLRRSRHRFGLDDASGAPDLLDPSFYRAPIVRGASSRSLSPASPFSPSSSASSASAGSGRSPSTERPLLGLRPGDLLDVRLQDGATSEAGGVILAEVIERFQREEIVVPKGSLLRGRAWAGDRRLFVDFFEVVVRGQAFVIKASAVDGTYPGLRARRREASFKVRSRAGVSRGLIDAAATAGGLVTGASGRVVTDSVLEETVPIAKDVVTPEESYVLEVAARYRFRVRVTE